MSILSVSILFPCLLSVVIGVLAQKPTDAVPSLTYSELIAQQSEYANTRIRVTGSWHILFEISSLHAPGGNIRKDAAWVFLESDDLCEGSKSKLKSIGDYAGEMSVVFTGKLQAGGGFGHQNGYKYQFVVDCVESIRKIRRPKST